MQIFQQRYFNLDNEYRLYFSRFGIGLQIAFCCGVINLYHLRQTVLKQAIWMTGSNSLWRVLPGCLLIGAAYAVGLTAVWTVPSLAVESAVRLYDATSHVVLNRLARQSIVNHVLQLK